MEYVVSKFDEYATLLVRMIADDHDYGHSFVDDKYNDYNNKKNKDDGDYDDDSWVKIDTHLECTCVD